MPLTTVQPTASLTSSFASHDTNSPPSTYHSACSKNCTLRSGPTTMTQKAASWSKCQGTVIIGRIHFTVDRANNTTITRTSYEAQLTFTSNGSRVTSAATDLIANQSQVLTRTDIDANGTVIYMRGTTTVLVFADSV